MMCVKKIKNEKRKSTRMPLLEEGKTSKVTLGQFDTLAFPHIYHHTYQQGQSYF